MSKKYYAVKLNPCRPDFAQTMTDEEKSIMQQHAAYWREQMSKGNVLVFGPVLDPAAVYGLGIVVVDHEQQLEDFIAGDPATRINHYEYHPMLAVTPGQ